MDENNNYETSYNTYSNRNNSFDSAIQIRLDSRQIIENIEIYLRGLEVRFESDENGQIKQTQHQVGKPLLNADGVRTLLNWVQLSINSQVAQGNWVVDKGKRSSDYDIYIGNFREDLCKMLIIKCDDWDIIDEDIEGIIDCIMIIVEPFMSRLIDNKERESYQQTLKTIESNTIKDQQSSRGFSLLNRG